MTTAEYWARRAEQRMDGGMGAADELVERLERHYRNAGQQVDYEIKRLYERYAGEYGLSYADAMREITGSEYREWRMTLQEYVERINATGDDALLRELDILSTRSRVTRWQQVETAIKVNATELVAKQEAMLRELLGDQYRKTYYGQVFDVHKGLGYGRTLEMLSARDVATTISYPWSGASFSERVWRSRESLVNTLRDTLTQGLIRGNDMRHMATVVRDAMGSAMHRAETLVRTETAHIIERATIDGYEAADIEEYEILATLDRRTSRICQKQDGKRYKVSEAKEGANMPPFHPNCRTTTVAVVPGDDAGGSERAARDEEGNHILVPADMTYEEWDKRFVVHTGIQNSLQGALKGAPDGYLDAVLERYKGGGEAAKLLFDKWFEPNAIADGNYAQGAHYSPRDKRIRMSFLKDAENNCGAGATLFHEVGHLVDEATGYPSFRNAKFAEALKKDYNAFIQSFKRDSVIRTKTEAYAHISMALRDGGQIHKLSAVSDLLEGLSGGRIQGGYGHGVGYWKQDKRLIAIEGFAHFYEGQFSQERSEMLAGAFPRAMEEFTKMLEGVSK